MPKITPHLWFDMNAEEAMNFYTSVFKNSRIISIDYYPDNVEEEHMKGMEGKVLRGVFQLDGVELMCLDGGPVFKFNESISLVVDCENQEEVDELWTKLSAVPEAEKCGWLKDKFGLSWQILPRDMGQYVSGPDKEKSARAVEAMLKMKKIDLSELKRVYESS